MNGQELVPDSISLYRAATTAETLSSLEYWRWWLAELLTDLDTTNDDDRRVLESSAAFARFHVEEAVREIERRLRLRHHPAAPPWPNGRRSAWPDAQTVKDHIDIPGYFRLLGVEPIRQGKGYVVPCDLPIHPGKDDAPSLRITSSRRGWHFFVCNAGGDLFALHCARTGLPFVEALAELAAEVGLIARGDFRRAG